MCGIAGLLKLGPNFELDKSLMNSIFGSIRHRGPDGERYLPLSELGLTLFHSRLAINDLTETGSQPMTSRCGRYVLVFNGEVYNFRSLAFQLDLDPEGLSDTRVFLELIVQSGITQALNQAYGMFAFALVDTRSKILTLGRDRFGEKPLYYGVVNIEGNPAFIFSSEMRTFRVLSDKDIIYTPEAIAEYGHFGFVNSPSFSIPDIKRLTPGHLFHLGIEGIHQDANNAIGPEKPWIEPSINKYSENLGPQCDQVKTNVYTFRETLFSVVENCLSADVEVGTFLSGGVDSSLITAVAAQIKPSAVRSYTVGFSDQDYDESRHAELWATSLNIEHHLIKIGDDTLAERLPKILETIDEPFADSSYIPCYLVSEAASRDVKVVLTGDGGDEIFGGYNRHVFTPFLLKIANCLPRPLLKNLSSVVDLANQLNLLGWVFAQNTVRPAEKIEKAVRLLRLASEKDLNRLYPVFLTNPDFRSVLSQDLLDLDILPNDGLFDDDTQLSVRRQLMSKDVHNYLPNDILYKVDRASMQNGLEVRAPFLDFRLTSLASRMPEKQLIRGRQGKIMLRSLLKELAGPDWVDRPKSGFSVPLARVFRTSLRSFVETRLQRIDHRFIDNEKVQSIWKCHLNSTADHSQFVWQILVLERFLR